MTLKQAQQLEQVTRKVTNCGELEETIIEWPLIVWLQCPI